MNFAGGWLALTLFAFAAFGETSRVTSRRGETVVKAVIGTAETLEFDVIWDRKIAITKDEFKRRTDANWTANLLLRTGGATALWYYHEGGFVMNSGRYYRIPRPMLERFHTALGLTTKEVPRSYKRFSVHQPARDGESLIGESADPKTLTALEDLWDDATPLDREEVKRIPIDGHLAVKLEEVDGKTRTFVYSTTGDYWIFSRWGYTVRRVRPEHRVLLNHMLFIESAGAPTIDFIQGPKSVYDEALRKFVPIFARKQAVRIGDWSLWPERVRSVNLTLHHLNKNKAPWYYYRTGLFQDSAGQAFQLTWEDTVAMNSIFGLDSPEAFPLTMKSAKVEDGREVEARASMRTLEDIWLRRTPVPVRGDFEYVIEIKGERWNYSPTGFARSGETTVALPKARVAEFNALLGLPCWHGMVE